MAWRAVVARIGERGCLPHHPTVAHHHDAHGEHRPPRRPALSAARRRPQSPPAFRRAQPGASADRSYRPAGTARPLAEQAVSLPNGPDPARRHRSLEPGLPSSTVVCRVTMARRAAVRSRLKPGLAGVVPEALLTGLAHQPLHHLAKREDLLAQTVNWPWTSANRFRVSASRSVRKSYCSPSAR